MTRSSSSPTTYAQGLITYRSSANGRSSVHAPPRRSRRSSTSTLRPARARYAAAVRPLWPPPITIASQSRLASSAIGSGRPTSPSLAAISFIVPLLLPVSRGHLLSGAQRLPIATGDHHVEGVHVGLLGRIASGHIPPGAHSLPGQLAYVPVLAI